MNSAIRLLPILLVILLFTCWSQLAYAQSNLNDPPYIINEGNLTQTSTQAESLASSLNFSWRLILALIAVGAVWIAILIIREGRIETNRKFYSPSLGYDISYNEIRRARKERNKRVSKSRKILKAA